MKKLILARYGGLSPVKQKHFTQNEEEMSWHGAPEKYGIYAFLWPYIDWFLLSGTNKLKTNHTGKKRDSLNHRYRKFSVQGDIWVHLVPPAKYTHLVKKKFGSWNLIDSRDFQMIMTKLYSQELKYSRKDFKEFCKVFEDYKSPYRFVSKDHLEVFIPRRTKVIS